MLRHFIFFLLLLGPITIAHLKETTIGPNCAMWMPWGVGPQYRNPQILLKANPTWPTHTQGPRPSSKSFTAQHIN